MTTKSTKSDFQKLADARAREAKILLDAGELDGAYYLAGYAVECAVKACIIKLLNSSDHWPDKKFSAECWSHDLKRLLELADLDATIGSPALEANWLIVRDWKEDARYESGRREVHVVAQFYQAITDPTDGVLTWLKTQW